VTHEQAITKNYIDVVVDSGAINWRFIGLYGEPEWSPKDVTWDALHSIRGDGSIPWLVMGDFNEILFNGAEGGRLRTQRQLQAFHDALSDCELVDMGYIGDLFTWHWGKIWERLDRAVANNLWSDLYPHATLINSEMTRSDHRPIVMGLTYLADHHEGERGRKKRFEARWLQEDTVEEMIKATWARASARGEGPSFLDKVREVHEDLHKWDKDVLKNPVKRMADLKRDLERLRRGPMTDANMASQKEIMVRLELMLEQEEIFWNQRARANWLKSGDHNTSFFHNYAMKRKKKNTIKGLIDEQGIF
jgi:hypothetical protein